MRNAQRQIKFNFWSKITFKVETFYQFVITQFDSNNILWLVIHIFILFLIFLFFFVFFINTTILTDLRILDVKSTLLNLFKKSVSKDLARTQKRTEVIKTLLPPRNVELQYTKNCQFLSIRECTLKMKFSSLYYASLVAYLAVEGFFRTKWDKIFFQRRGLRWSLHKWTFCKS